VKYNRFTVKKGLTSWKMPFGADWVHHPLQQTIVAKH